MFRNSLTAPNLTPQSQTVTTDLQSVLVTLFVLAIAESDAADLDQSRLNAARPRRLKALLLVLATTVHTTHHPRLLHYSSSERKTRNGERGRASESGIAQPTRLLRVPNLLR